MRILKFAAIAVLMVLPVTTAQAAIQFGGAVNLGMSNIAGAGSDILDVIELDFGSGTASGRIAANGQDTNGSGSLDAGDRTRVVGHAEISGYTTTTSSVSPFDGGGLPSFNITALLKNVNGTVIAAGPFNPFANIFDPGSVAGDTGLVEIYVDTSPETAFDSSNATTSADDILVATLEIVSGGTQFNAISPVSGTSQTTFIAKLVSQLGDGTATLADDFFQLASGLDPLNIPLFTFTNSTDVVLGPSATFTGIFGGGDPLDIDTAFDPFTPGDGFDVISRVDGNTQFSIVPEPLSAVVWIGLASVVGFVSSTRRRA